MSRATKLPFVIFASLADGSPYKLVFGKAFVVLSAKEHGLVSEALRCCCPDAEVWSMKGDQGWTLHLKSDSKGINLEVEPQVKPSNEWSSGVARISFAQGIDLAKDLDFMIGKIDIEFV